VEAAAARWSKASSKSSGKVRGNSYGKSDMDSDLGYEKKCGKTKANYPIFDGLYHPFMVIWDIWILNIPSLW